MDSIHPAEEDIDRLTEMYDSDPGVYAPRLAAALTERSDFLARNGYPEDAAELATKAVDVIRRALDSGFRLDPGLTNALSRLADSLAAAGKDDVARGVTLESVQILRMLADTDPEGYRTQLGTSLVNAGMRLRDMRDASISTALLEEAVDLFRQANEKRQEARALGALGEIYYYRGKSSIAEDVFGRLLYLSTQADDLSNERLCYNWLGILAQQRGDYDQAETYYRQSLSLSEQHGDQAASAMAYFQLGSLAEKRGNRARARSYFRQSASISERVGDKNLAATTYFRLRHLGEDSSG